MKFKMPLTVSLLLFGLVSTVAIGGCTQDARTKGPCYRPKCEDAAHHANNQPWTGQLYGGPRGYDQAATEAKAHNRDAHNGGPTGIGPATVDLADCK